MEMKANIYTSCYSKMLARHKNQNDIYIQVSRSLFYPKKGIDGKSIMSMIDLNVGQNLGMYDANFEEYEQRIRGEEYKDILTELAEILSEKMLLEDFTDKEIMQSEKEFDDFLKDLESKDSETKKQITDYENLTLEEKEDLSLVGITEKNIKDLQKDLKNYKPCYTLNFFLLCFEDLDTKYTEKDEKKYNGQVKAGEFKTCHRTVLAKVLNERFNLNITEW